MQMATESQAQELVQVAFTRDELKEIYLLIIRNLNPLRMIDEPDSTEPPIADVARRLERAIHNAPAYGRAQEVIKRIEDLKAFCFEESDCAYGSKKLTARLSVGEHMVLRADQLHDHRDEAKDLLRFKIARRLIELTK